MSVPTPTWMPDDAITVTVSDASRHSRPIWAITCSDHGLVATRVDRSAADRVADEHLTRDLAAAEEAS